MELCVKCDRPTGRSGAAEDSLMITGHPYCEPCYEETLPEAVDYLDGRCGTLAAQLKARDASLALLGEVIDEAMRLTMYGGWKCVGCGINAVHRWTEDDGTVRGFEHRESCPVAALRARIEEIRK